METNVKKKKNIVLIAVLVAIVVLCVVAVIVLLLSSGGKEKKLKEQLALGDRYLSEMDYEKAIRAYKEALKIDPESEEALEGFRNAYEQWIQAEPARAEELYEEEIRDLNELLAEGRSEQLEQLLKKTEERTAVATLVTLSPTPAPTVTPAPTLSPTPVPEDEEEKPEEGSDDESDWHSVDFSAPLVWENAQYVLDRLVEEDGWTYGDHKYEIYKESYDAAGNYVGLAEVMVITDPEYDMSLMYQIPKDVGGAGLGDAYMNNELTMEEAYNEIIQGYSSTWDE